MHEWGVQLRLQA